MSDRKYPPCSIEAEEAVIGAILLNSEALTAIKDWLPVNAFFVTAHQSIYSAMRALHSKGKTPDFITLSTYLDDQKRLDEVGGTAKLSQLLNRTVSVSNIDRYALLVMEKYERRQLIALGAEITSYGYDQIYDLDDIYKKISHLLPERLTGASQVKSQPKISKIRYFVTTHTGDHQLELEAEITDDSDLADQIASLKEKACIAGQQLWGDEFMMID